MQTTLTATLIENQSNIELIKSQLEQVMVLHSYVQRKLYAEIMNYFKVNKVNVLPKKKINQLKQDYQLKYHINARQYNSIFSELMGKISSVLELNKDYIQDTKDNIKSLEVKLKSKQKNLDLILKSAKNKALTKAEESNLSNLKTKVYYLKQRLNKANLKLNRLNQIKETGNPHLCFGSNKLFRQQYLIGTDNNLTEFRTHADWKKAWIESRTKSFMLLGSSDETYGNQNCQISHVENNTYELKVNVKPKETKIVNRYIKFKIELHNDKLGLIQNILKNKDLNQALTYRFHKNKKGLIQIFISLDKSKQQPKIKSIKQLGTIGIDINADHLSLTEVDRFGNLLKSFDIQLNLKDKTTYQSLDNIACAVKKITDYAVSKNKPVVIEKLDFSQKKKSLREGFDKTYNVMLSSFAYRKIIELIKSRSYDKGIEVIEVNPAYTSKIGKFKYQNKYKLTTHQSAAFVIARRGLLSYSKTITVKDKQGIEKEKSITIMNKEKIISNQLSKYYSFELPDRTVQRKENIYWKDIELNYLKEKRHRLLSKRNKSLIQDKHKLNSALSCEITSVSDNLGTYRSPKSKSIIYS